MGKTGSKRGQVFKVVSISMLFAMSAILWTYSGAQSSRLKSRLTLDGDSSDTIILLQERSRVRTFVDISKKISFNNWGHPNYRMDLQTVSYVELKSLFINAYQRNVFYVYASFSVP